MLKIYSAFRVLGLTGRAGLMIFPRKRKIIGTIVPTKYTLRYEAKVSSKLSTLQNQTRLFQGFQNLNANYHVYVCVTVYVS
jgi:hypothetical protein